MIANEHVEDARERTIHLNTSTAAATVDALSGRARTPFAEEFFGNGDEKTWGCHVRYVYGGSVVEAQQAAVMLNVSKGHQQVVPPGLARPLRIVLERQASREISRRLV